MSHFANEPDGRAERANPPMSPPPPVAPAFAPPAPNASLTPPPALYPPPPPAPAAAPARPARGDGVLQPTPFAAYAAYAPPNLDPPPESTRPRSGRQGFTPHSDNKSPAVGVVSFLMTLAANIMTFMALLPIVPFLRDAIAARRAGRSYDASNLALMPGFDTIAMVATGAFWLGVAGFVLGIVAAVTKRGRGWGFIAILVAIFGPIVVATAWAGMAVGR